MLILQEIMLPLTIVVKNFEKLRRWEEPYLTISFLAFSYTVTLRLYSYYLKPLAFAGF